MTISVCFSARQAFNDLKDNSQFNRSAKFVSFLTTLFIKCSEQITFFNICTVIQIALNEIRNYGKALYTETIKS